MKKLSFAFRLLVDTPEKFEQLKNGVFDDKYKRIEVTSDATPDVLLQPQHFANSTFRSLAFISLDKAGDNEITISPGRYAHAAALFRSGENPLSGIPKDYPYYVVTFAYPAVPTDENIDAILSWSRAFKIQISDQEDVAVKLTKRSAELKQLAKLGELHVTMQDDTYEKISVAALIENLPSLFEIDFSGMHMSDAQIKDFEVRNRVPSGWKGWIIGKLIYYRNKP